VRQLRAITRVSDKADIEFPSAEQTEVVERNECLAPEATGGVAGNDKDPHARNVQPVLQERESIMVTSAVGGDVPDYAFVQIGRSWAIAG
jgi:hypothetical protein